jgi:hypothetical protein
MRDDDNSIQPMQLSRHMQTTFIRSFSTVQTDSQAMFSRVRVLHSMLYYSIVPVADHSYCGTVSTTDEALYIPSTLVFCPFALVSPFSKLGLLD